MACVLPQLNWPPSTSPVSHSRLFFHHHVKGSNPIHLRSQCVHFRSKCVSLQTVAVIDIEKLQRSTLEAHTATLTATRPLRHTGAIGLPAKIDLEAFLADKLLTGEEATIAAAAAEAVALARKAVEVAKDAAQMIGNGSSIKLENLENSLLETDIFQLESVRPTEMETLGMLNNSNTTETKPQEGSINGSSSNDARISCISDLIHDELDLPTEDTINVTVRSKRQSERKARRAKAIEKSPKSPISAKSASCGKKKHPVPQDRNYSDPLPNLRKITTTSKLLTASEEIELSKGIQDLLKLNSLHEELAESNGSQPTLAQWAEIAGTDTRTLNKRLHHGTYCKDRMLKSNIRLVISIAKNFQGAGMSLPDLVQEGYLGLVKGVEKFDASKGFRFSTYAHWWIKQAVRRGLSEKSRTIHLPFHMVDSSYRVREAKKRFFSENKRYPDNEEIAKATGLTVKRVAAVMLLPKSPISLDAPHAMFENYKTSDGIADPSVLSPDEIFSNQLMKHEVSKVLDSLNPREKQVVRWRFGFEDGRMKSLQEIGDLMGVTRERIRQIESCAFRKLRNKKRTKNLRQYINS